MSKVQTLLKCVLKLFAWHRVCFSTIWMWLFLVTVSYWRTERWHIFRIVPILDSNLNSNIILNVNSTLFSYVSFSYVFFSDGNVIFGNECVSIAKHVKSAMLENESNKKAFVLQSMRFWSHRSVNNISTDGKVEMRRKKQCPNNGYLN